MASVWEPRRPCLVNVWELPSSPVSHGRNTSAALRWLQPLSAYAWGLPRRASAGALAWWLKTCCAMALSRSSMGLDQVRKFWFHVDTTTWNGLRQIGWQSLVT